MKSVECGLWIFTKQVYFILFLIKSFVDLFTKWVTLLLNNYLRKHFLYVPLFLCKNINK